MFILRETKFSRSIKFAFRVRVFKCEVERVAFDYCEVERIKHRIPLMGAKLNGIDYDVLGNNITPFCYKRFTSLEHLFFTINLCNDEKPIA